jgi:uracil-DNA glycosylase
MRSFAFNPTPSAFENLFRQFRVSMKWEKPKQKSLWDAKVKLMVIGLAPAAHGGNGTVRIFTGDSSGDWLVRALFETGFANKPISVSRDDGSREAYLTATVRCAPPK